MGTFSLIFYLAMKLLVTGGSWLGTYSISKRKNQRPGLLRIAVSALIPPLGLLWSALQKKQPKRGRSPEEQELFNQQFNVQTKKDLIEKCNKRVDKLSMFRERSVLYKLTHPGQWLPGVRMRKNYKDIANYKEDIANDFAMLAIAEKKMGFRGKDRFISVTMEGSSKHGYRFGIPYGIDEGIANQIKFLVAKQYGCNSNQPGLFYVSDHKAGDMMQYGENKTVIVFDTKEGVVTPFGAELSEEQLYVLSYFQKNQEIQLSKRGLVDEDGFYIKKGLLEIKPVGNEAVGVSYNGVLLAYAVAGPDGKIRAMGNDVKASDQKGLKLASAIYEKLKTSVNINEWIKVAGMIVMSEGNFLNVAEEIKRSESVSRRLEEKTALRNRITNLSKKQVNNLKT